ncbi:hypothetical protein ACF0H5_010760 [Mactra antiquata]
MAKSDNKENIDSMFIKMGEKLGWFKTEDTKYDQSMLSTAAKAFTPLKIKNENGSHGKSTDDKRRNRLKLKKKSKPAANADKTKGNSSLKLKNTITKPSGFSALLSSDDDEEEKLTVNKAVKTLSTDFKQVLCSDSDDEKVIPQNNKVDCTVSCIYDSFIEPGESRKLSHGPSLPDYNDTIIQKRVSIASCTLDLDNFGEPLVESTRIFRRSNVKDRLIFEQIEESDSFNESNDVEKVTDDKTKIGEILEDKDMDNSRYVTAIENLESLKLSPEPSEDIKLTGDLDINGDVFEPEREDGPNEHEIDINLDKSCIEVEVVDIGIQTDTVHDVDGRSPLAIEKMVDVYTEDTVTDNNFKLSNDIYTEETIDNEIVCECGKNDPFTGNTEIEHDIDDHLDDTEYSFEVNKERDVYNDNTKRNESKQVYEEFTIDGSIVKNIYVDATRADNGDGHKAEVLVGINDDNVRDFCKARTGNASIEVNHDVYEDDTNVDIDNVYANNDDDVVVYEEKTVDIYEDDTNVDHNGDNDDVYEEKTVENSDSCQGRCDDLSDFIIDTTGCHVKKFDNNIIETLPESDTNTDSESDVSEYEVNDIGTQTEENIEDTQTPETELGGKTETGLVESESLGNPFDENMEEHQDGSYDHDLENAIEPPDEDDVDVRLGGSNSDEESRKSVDVENSKMDMNGSKSYTSVDISSKVENNNWRSRRYSESSDSDSDALENFFQKMKGKSQPIKSDSESSSSASMKDFIVEDNEMTSESDYSDDDIQSPEYIPSCSPTEESESDNSEMSHESASSSDDDSQRRKESKKVKKRSPARSFSSSDEEKDSECLVASSSETKIVPQPNGTRKKKGQDPVSKSKTKRSKILQKSRVDFEISSDSDAEDIKVPHFPDIVKPDVNKSKGSDFNKTDESQNDFHDSFDNSVFFKTPNPIRRKKTNLDKENCFKTPTSLKKHSVSSKSSIRLLDDDSDSDSLDFIVTPSPRVGKSSSGTKPKTSNKVLTPVAMGNKSLGDYSAPSQRTPTYNFLKSLSGDINDERRDLRARRYIKNFKKTKEELSAYLFTMFNKTVFDNKLPSNMSVTWNKRLLRTAGYCAYKKNTKNPDDRTARIELSTKVCDTAERLRDTLIHELCHAAVWLINGVNDGHGPFWKYWARHATRIHPELPSINRCHSYSINTKFTYKCKKCGYSIGRHSKSLDTTRKVCGYCRGEFELIQNSVPTTPRSASSSSMTPSSTNRSQSTTPRLPNKFALFVKDNYNSVKKRKQDLKHGEVMKELSKMFAESKITS